MIKFSGFFFHHLLIYVACYFPLLSSINYDFSVENFQQFSKPSQLNTIKLVTKSLISEKITTKAYTD